MLPNLRWRHRDIDFSPDSPQIERFDTIRTKFLRVPKAPENLANATVLGHRPWKLGMSSFGISRHELETLRHITTALPHY